MRPYPRADDLLAPLRRVARGRPPRRVAPGRTVHVVARCNTRESDFKAASDFAILLAYLGQMCGTYAVTLDAYTLMSRGSRYRTPNRG